MKTWRKGLVISAIALAVVIALAGHIFGDRQIIYNNSPSVPEGWYIRTDKKPAVGDIVDFPIPETVRGYVESRTGPYEDWFILKKIVGAEGDHIKTIEGQVVINGEQLAEIQTEDSNGHPVPIWSGDRKLEADEYFVLSKLIERSFDSRVYGPIKRADITGVYRKIW